MALSESVLINAGVQAGLVDAQQLVQLKLQAKRERIRLLEAVMREGRFPEAALYQALAELRNIPFLLPQDLLPDEEVMAKLPRAGLQRRSGLPVQYQGERYIAVDNPDDLGAVESVQRLTGLKFKLALAAPQAIKAVLRRWLSAQQQGLELQTPLAEANAIELFDELMKEAYLRRATDLHLEPGKSEWRVRLRVDGHLQEHHRPLSLGEGEAVTTRIKVLANLDIAEQRLSQDGGMTYQMLQWDVPASDIRVATIPTRWGERVTLRLLGQGTAGLDLERLGLPPYILEPFRVAINRPHGIILVTGPTGSGKSTTLYAALHELDANQTNILTVEDPIEQVMEGISQVQVSSKVDFAHAMRSFLRHDPDVILVGEIRDIETAETALKAAMTGHLVLSTLHTNSAVNAVTRLTDIGAAPYLIGATLIGVIAQRLVRRLCLQCRQAYAPDLRERRLLGVAADSSLELYQPGSCAGCLGTGYVGRIGLYESLWIDQSLGELIASGRREDAIRTAAGDQYYTLWEDGRQKVIEGITSFSEVVVLLDPALLNAEPNDAGLITPSQAGVETIASGGDS